jgi:2,3-dihydroxybenzoate decarboxylase
MIGKVTLEDHFATPATLGDSQVFGAHVWSELGPRLIDFQDKRLRQMDASGVELMIVSLNAPAVQAIHDVTRAVEVARQANDVLAEEVRKRPDRFAGLAALPMQDPEAAANELERCVRDLGFKGALVNGFSQVGAPDQAV